MIKLKYLRNMLKNKNITSEKNKISEKDSFDKVIIDKENNYTISLDYISDKIKPLQLSNIAFKNFSEISGTGPINYVVNIGFDFGNSSTKIVYSRQTKKNSLDKRILKNERQVLNCKDLNIFSIDNIPQSTISKILMNNDKVRIENFKLDLLDKIANQNCENIFKENAYYYCVYYVSCLLQFTKISIIKDNMLKRIKNIEWKINMGIPSDGKVGTSKIQSVFLRILSTAISLSSNKKLLSKTGINFNEWKNICDIEPELKNDLECLSFQVFPELYSEALNLYESDNNPGDYAILVDVGSVTLDLTFIKKYKIYGSDKTHITLLNPRVLPLGIEKLIDINNKLRITAEKEEINSFEAICNTRTIPELSNHIKKEFGAIIGSFYENSSNYLNLASNTTFKFYWFGGARDALFVKDFFLEPFKKNSYLYKIKPNYQPHYNLNNESNSYRYSVAYGLILTDFYDSHPSIFYSTKKVSNTNSKQLLAARKAKIYGV